jgi:DNA-binding PadR family transcriptional regulator
MTERVDDHLPLAPAVFHVLLALADGEKHGYAMMREIRTRTSGAVALSASTLYGIVKRLLENGLLEESSERPDPALDDERRRYYRLTEFGRVVAVAESRRLEATLGIARAKRLIPSPRLK